MARRKQPLVSVVIVTKDRRQLTLDCLASVFAMTYPNLEVILVDNASSDGTVEAVGKRFPGVKVITAKKNLGLNGGKNLGQSQARGDYLLFLDSDTLVDTNLVTELVRVAESDPRVGVVCPKMYYIEPKDVIWYAGAEVNLLTSRTKNIGCNEVDRGQYDQLRPTQFAPTAYLVTRKTADKLSGHDESLFMTYGDTDYGFRAKAAGFKVVFCPRACLWHRIKMEENITSIRALGYNRPMRAYYFARNRVLFMKRHAPPLNFFVFLLVFLPLFTVYITGKIVIFGGGWRFLKPHLRGSWDGLRYAFGGQVANVYT